MKYVALLSGGKDSCYNLVHCHKNGHELVAAASLGPGPGKEEIDSYMYQTVGQDAIELVAQALDVPLVRRVIIGTAVEQGSEYGTREARAMVNNTVSGDETEDMYALLADVKERFPEVEGVSVGAILSSYQRVRVEHVCRRLSLTPLTYLWQRDQAELLSEMIDAGLEAILIKVAGIGLKEAHLGKTLGEMHTTLTKLNTMYGLHVCGEGGEYETLTLDSPMFKRRIVLQETEIVSLSEDKYAPVAYLRIKGARLEDKEHGDNFEVTIPALFEPEYSDLRAMVEEALTLKLTRPSQPQPSISLLDEIRTKQIGPWVALSNVVAKDLPLDASLEEEVATCFHRLRELLEQHGLRLSHLSNVNIFIANMADFGRINAVYTTFFGSSPPARACVAVDLPSPYRVKLDCIAFAESSSSDRQALHVQGLSYWAPANIGPYSQAIVVDGAIFVSGQIGMIPPSLALPSSSSLSQELALASQHAGRIIKALETGTGGGWEGIPLLNVFWYADAADALAVRHCMRSKVPTLHVVVKQLPKNALVEKQVFYHANRPTRPVDDEDEVILTSSYSSGSQADDAAELHWQVSSLGSTSWTCAVVCGKAGQEPVGFARLWSRIRELDRVKERALSVRLFYTASCNASAFNIESIFGGEMPAVTSIPCRFVAAGEAEEVFDFAIVILAV
ncbi:hypothetical protein PENSPDRAFT_684603 [Peniophora sp. CONT]|nr:hypothetical protein PENSPDRAFT_684603 [Peniophora sp. CONT]